MCLFSIGHNVQPAIAGGLIEASPVPTDQRLFEDTYFISEPQIKFHEVAELLRANDEPLVRPLAIAGWLPAGGGTQIRHVDVSAVKEFSLS